MNNKYYENGCDVRAKRVPNAVLDCVIHASTYRYKAFENGGIDLLYDLMHDFAEEVLARVEIVERATPSPATAEAPNIKGYLHTMTCETGESMPRLTDSEENPFGVPGKHYDASYTVTCEPLVLASRRPVEAAVPARLTGEVVPHWLYGSTKELAIAIWRDNYKEDAPQWQPLDDLAGVISQIDNMVSGMAKKSAAPAEGTAVQMPEPDCKGVHFDGHSAAQVEAYGDARAEEARREESRQWEEENATLVNELRLAAKREKALRDQRTAGGDAVAWKAWPDRQSGDITTSKATTDAWRANNVPFRALDYIGEPVAEAAAQADGDEDSDFEEPDHGETVLRVQGALGITTTGWISPDVVVDRIEQLQRKLSAAAPTAHPAPPDDARELGLLDAIECDLPYLFGRAAKEGHEAGQALAAQVQQRIRDARAALRQPGALGAGLSLPDFEAWFGEKQVLMSDSSMDFVTIEAKEAWYGWQEAARRAARTEPKEPT